MSRHALSFIAVILAGCTTTTMLSATPDQLPQLASVNMYGPQQFVPAGKTKAVTVSRDDEIRLRTAEGTLPRSEHVWATLSTLRVNRRVNPSVVTVTGNEAPVSPDCGITTCLPPPESATLTNVQSADLRVSRVDPGLTALAVAGGVLAAMALAVAIGAAVFAASGGIKWGCPQNPHCGYW